MKKTLQIRYRQAVLIALGTALLFIVLAVCSYDINDAAWSTTGNNSEIYNFMGSLGALCADILLFFFGYSAYLLVGALMTAILIFICEQQHKLSEWLTRTIGALCIIVASCGLMHQALPMSNGLSLSYCGGALGISLWQKCEPLLGRYGFSLCSISLFISGVILLVGSSWLMHIRGVVSNFNLILLRYVIKYIEFIRKLLSNCVAFKPRKANTVTRQQQFITPIMQNCINKSVTEPTVAEIKEFKPTKASNTSSTIISKSTSKTDNFPEVDLLISAHNDAKAQQNHSDLQYSVEEKLRDFGVDAKVVDVLPGPVVTRFELTLAPGVKASKISGIARDLARSLSVMSVRVVEIIPGKAVIGLEIPNKLREIVRLHTILCSPIYQQQKSRLTLALGKDIAGDVVVANLAQMPHLLVAGTTGSGKSVGVNAMLMSLLYKSSPAEVRFILIDPKMLELSVYEGIPHLLTPVVTDMKDAAQVLRWCVAEMERRYQLLAALGVRNLAGFNDKIAKAKSPILDPLLPEGEAEPLLPLPNIVVIIDEFADMIMVVGKKVEELIARIAQKARAAGIHLILATQRPSVDVITGLIKANIPTRIAYQVSSRIDSRTILDQQGAENLLGHGDMLYLPPGTGIPVRVHGAYVTDEEVHRVVQALKQTGEPDYLDLSISANIPLINTGMDEDSPEDDPLYDQAVALVLEQRKVSTSFLQRRFKIGYNRAARLVEAMESSGLVSAIQNNGQREVLVKS